MITVKALIELLDKEYPNDISLLKDKSPEQIAAAIAERELIDYIKRLQKDN